MLENVSIAGVSMSRWFSSRVHVQISYLLEVWAFVNHRYKSLTKHPPVVSLAYQSKILLDMLNEMHIALHVVQPSCCQSDREHIDKPDYCLADVLLITTVTSYMYLLYYH